MEGRGTYLGLFQLSREVRLRDCRIEATAAEAYGIARVITRVLDIDGVSVTVSGNGGALGKSAVRATFRLAAGKHKGCILGTAEESTIGLFVDTDYTECDEDAIDTLTERECPQPTGKSMTQLMEAARTCNLRCVRKLVDSQ